ncbi:MAG: HlyD family type I secretion periplasmic adaptor subunit, partial [Limibaculum sp.]
MTRGMTGKPASDGWGAGGYIRFGIFCVALLAVGLGGWAATAKLKGAVISSGHLRVERQRQVVQHLD